jgi:hypothetical protein
MSYQEKRVIVSIITGLILLGVYCIYAFERFQSGIMAPDDVKAWSGMILIFIGVGILASIVIQIVFHILLSMSIAIEENLRTGQCDNKDIEKTIHLEMVTDEMDELIELKSMRIGFIVAGLGFILALLTQYFEYSSAILLNVLFIAFSIGSLIEGVTQLYFYRKGVKNG